jgi:hypothetical protein
MAFHIPLVDTLGGKMPLTAPQRLFDWLLKNRLVGGATSGWTTDVATSRPSVTVTSEVILALIDAAVASAVVIPDTFTSQLEAPIKFICEDVKKRGADGTLDLGNYIRALSAYLFFMKYASTPASKLSLDEDFLKICEKGINDTFKPTGSLIEKWLYINGCKDLMDAAPDRFAHFNTTVQLAQGQLEEYAKGSTLSPYDAAIVLDALLPRRVALSENVTETGVIKKCVNAIVEARTDAISALISTTREDEYRVYTPAFVIKALAMLRRTLDETAKRYSYQLITEMYSKLDIIEQRFRMAHLLRAFLHAGIQPEDAEYINALLKSNAVLEREKSDAVAAGIPQTDIDALASARQKKLIYVGGPTSVIFAAFSPTAYFGLFGGLFVVFFVLLRLSTTTAASRISLLAILAMGVFIAYQAHMVDKNLRNKPLAEKGHSVLIFFIMTLFYMFSAVAFLLRATQGMLDQVNNLH